MLSATSMLPRTIVALACAVLVSLRAPAALAAPLPPAQDPFYSYAGSAPLTQIAPGTVLAERPIALSADGLPLPATAEQLLYRTTGEQGQPTVTVTTVIRPLVSLITLLGPKIIAYQTAYDALGAQCDPSYTLQGGNPSDTSAQAEAALIAIYVGAGFTVTVPDYEGTSLDWAAGQESGRGTLDAIRATENYLQDPSSTPVGMLGYSGGSIATEWAAELAPSYAPELNIVGAAAGGVPVDPAHNVAYVDGGKDWAGVIPAALVALNRAFGADLTKDLTAYGKQVTAQVAGECIQSFAGAYPGLTLGKLLTGPSPALTAILNKLIMGTSPGHPTAPLLLAVGNSDWTGDGIMIASDVAALAKQYCQEGVPVTFKEYGGLDHDMAALPFEVDAFGFLADRFLGLPDSGNCTSISTVNSLAPLASNNARLHLGSRQ
jgi:secretory lipase